jgi:hypothetical protein
MKKTAAILTLLAVSLGISFVASANPTFTSTNPGFPKITVDPQVPSEYALGLCTTSEQLDCIQSVEAKIGSGPFQIPLALGNHVWSTETEDGLVIHRLQTENSGAPFEPRETVWQLDNGYQFMVGAGIMTPGTTSDNLGVMGTYAGSFDEAGLPMDFSVRIAIRTSWLRPQGLQFNAVSAAFNQESIPGGNLWTFSGSPSKIAIYGPEKSDTAMEDGWMEQADSEDRWLGFTVGHAGPTRDLSWWDPTCADTGYTAQAFNSSAAGSPEWNSEKGYLEFNIFAPHLTASGQPNKGFFRLWVHETYADCEWPGNNLSQADRLEALIVNEDGSIQDAQVSVTNENGVIYLDAGEFHYSAPTFIIRASTNVETPAYTPPQAAASTPASPTAISTKRTRQSRPLASASPSPSVQTKDDADQQTFDKAEPLSAPQEDNEPSGLIALGLGTAVVSAVIGLEIVRRRRAVKPAHRNR